jgi:hypothetical protein
MKMRTCLLENALHIEADAELVPARGDVRDVDPLAVQRVALAVSTSRDSDCTLT